MRGCTGLNSPVIFHRGSTLLLPPLLSYLTVTTNTILLHCYHHYYLTSLLPPLLSHYYLSLLPYLNTLHLTVTITDTSLVLKPFPSNKKYNIYVNRYLKRSQRSVVAECTVHSSDLICNCNSGSGNILETIRGLETTDSTSH